MKSKVIIFCALLFCSKFVVSVPFEDEPVRRRAYPPSNWHGNKNTENFHGNGFARTHQADPINDGQEYNSNQGGQPFDNYEINNKPFAQQALPKRDSQSEFSSGAIERRPDSFPSRGVSYTIRKDKQPIKVDNEQPMNQNRQPHNRFSNSVSSASASSIAGRERPLPPADLPPYNPGPIHTPGRPVNRQHFPEAPPVPVERDIRYQPIEEIPENNRYAPRLGPEHGSRKRPAHYQNFDQGRNIPIKTNKPQYTNNEYIESPSSYFGPSNVQNYEVHNVSPTKNEGNYLSRPKPSNTNVPSSHDGGRGRPSNTIINNGNNDYVQNPTINSEPNQGPRKFEIPIEPSNIEPENSPPQNNYRYEERPVLRSRPHNPKPNAFNSKPIIPTIVEIEKPKNNQYRDNPVKDFGFDNQAPVNNRKTPEKQTETILYGNERDAYEPRPTADDNNRPEQTYSVPPTATSKPVPADDKNGQPFTQPERNTQQNLENTNKIQKFHLNNKHMYTVIHPNGTVEHIDKKELMTHNKNNIIFLKNDDQPLVEFNKARPLAKDKPIDKSPAPKDSQSNPEFFEWKSENDDNLQSQPLTPNEYSTPPPLSTEPDFYQPYQSSTVNPFYSQPQRQRVNDKKLPSPTPTENYYYPPYQSPTGNDNTPPQTPPEIDYYPQPQRQPGSDNNTPPAVNDNYSQPQRLPGKGSKPPSPTGNDNNPQRQPPNRKDNAPQPQPPIENDYYPATEPPTKYDNNPPLQPQNDYYQGPQVNWGKKNNVPPYPPNRNDYYSTLPTQTSNDDILPVTKSPTDKGYDHYPQNPIENDYFPYYDNYNYYPQNPPKDKGKAKLPSKENNNKKIPNDLPSTTTISPEKEFLDNYLHSVPNDTDIYPSSVTQDDSTWISSTGYPTKLHTVISPGIYTTPKYSTYSKYPTNSPGILSTTPRPKPLSTKSHEVFPSSTPRSKSLTTKSPLTQQSTTPRYKLITTTTLKPKLQSDQDKDLVGEKDKNDYPSIIVIDSSNDEAITQKPDKRYPGEKTVTTPRYKLHTVISPGLFTTTTQKPRHKSDQDKGSVGGKDKNDYPSIIIIETSGEETSTQKPDKRYPDEKKHYSQNSPTSPAPKPDTSASTTTLPITTKDEGRIEDFIASLNGSIDDSGESDKYPTSSTKSSIGLTTTPLPSASDGNKNDNDVSIDKTKPSVTKDKNDDSIDKKKPSKQNEDDEDKNKGKPSKLPKDDDAGVVDKSKNKPSLSSKDDDVDKSKQKSAPSAKNDDDIVNKDKSNKTSEDKPDKSINDPKNPTIGTKPTVTTSPANESDVNTGETTTTGDNLLVSTTPSSDLKITLSIPKDSDGNITIHVDVPETAGKEDGLSNKTLVVRIDTLDDIINNDSAKGSKITTSPSDSNLDPDNKKLYFDNKPVDAAFFEQLQNVNNSSSLCVFYVYQIQPATQPILEREKETTIFANGTVVEKITETTWQNKNDTTPTVMEMTKTYQQNDKH